MYGVENDARVFFAKKGYYKGKEVTVTHRNPATGEVWLEDYPVGKAPIMYGCWVSADSVRFDGEVVTEKKETKKKGRRGVGYKRRDKHNIKET